MIDISTTKTAAYARIGYIPELRYYVLRNLGTRRLELWAESRGIVLNAIRLGNVELEFVRETTAYRAMDNEYNRQNYGDEIGRIYVDHQPAYVSTKEL